MIKYYCDLCGKTIHSNYVPKRMMLIDNTRGINAHTKSYDFCDECYAQLKSQVDNKFTQAN